MGRKKTQKEFESQIFEKYGNEYSVLGEYINTDTSILIKHNKCGKEYLTRPANLLRGYRCGTCHGGIIKTDELYKQQVKDAVGNEYSVLSKYVGAKDKIKKRHNKCGNVFSMTPDDFINGGNRCPSCSLKLKGIGRRKTNEEFLDEVFNLVGNEYTVLSPYTTYFKEVWMKHNECGEIYKVLPSQFLSCGSRCIACGKESKGEYAVRRYCQKINLQYEAQYRDVMCKSKKPLSFDFALFNRGSLMALIEYQGRQHYYPNDFFGGEKQFKKQQKHDNIKRTYCKTNNIPLIEIPYTIEDIESFLEKELDKLNQVIQLSIL